MIRSPRDEDFAALAAITNHYIAATAIHFGYDPVSAEDLREQCRHGARFPWLIVEEGGAVAGYAKAGVWRDRAAYHWTTEVGLYLDPGMHGRGLGTALYSDLFARLAGHDVHRALAGITLPNPESLALHARFGFRQVAHFTENGRKLGRYWDVVWLEKEI